MDVLMLSRIQFAANISFHILFPTITIALCWFLLFFKIRFNKTGAQHWQDLYQFWVKVFALSFALGVVSGITMSFQFGTNWPGYMEKVGNVAGPLLGYEVLTAFFLEATFLGVMIFGVNRVSNKMHTIATALVAVGTTISSFWILALNSWMQTPQGVEIIDGVVFVTSWWEVIFNPSFPYRLTHMLIASGLTASFLIMGISSYQLLKNATSRSALKGLTAATIFAAILIPTQIFVGDLHGLNTLKHQPAKVAAMEAIWHDEQGADLLLFAWPDEKSQKNHLPLAIPKGASLILTHDSNGKLQGLSSFKDEHPPVKPVFFGFRFMVGIGMLMLVASFTNLYFLRKKTLPKRLLQANIAMTFSGWLATLAGWYVTEIGRQPWLVQGILKTEDAVTHIANSNVAFSLALYLVVYVFLLAAFIHSLFYLAKKYAKKGEA